MPNDLKTARCYLLVGGADGALDVAVRVQDGRIAELTLKAPSGFGGMIWPIVAQMLVDAPLEPESLRERIARLTNSGLLPDEINLDPLVKRLVEMANS